MTWRLSDLPIAARLAAERAAAAQGNTLEVWLVEALRASLPPQAGASRPRPGAPEATEPRLAETLVPPDASTASQATNIAASPKTTDFATRIAAQLERIRQQPPALGTATAASPTIAAAAPTVPPAPEATASAPQATANFAKKRPALPSGPVSLLPLIAIMPARHRLRRGIDEHKLTALGTEISIHGVREPVLVRPTSDRAGYEIVAGERRRLAAERAGMTEIPAIVVEADDGAALLLSLAENLDRSDFTPLDEARAYLRLLTEFRVSPSGLAERLGISRSHVASSLRLLGLPQRARKAIESGRFNTEQAHRLLDAADPDAAAERLTASARRVS